MCVTGRVLNLLMMKRVRQVWGKFILSIARSMEYLILGS